MMEIPLPDPGFELDLEHDLFQDAPDGYDIVDRNGTILYINTNNRTNQGKSFIGTSIYDYFLPEYHEIVSSKIARVFDTGDLNSYELASDYGPGPRRYYMTNLRPIKRNGEVVAVSLYIRDITELKTAQNALIELNSQLEKRVQERTLELQQNIDNRERQQQILYNIMAAVNEKTEINELLPLMLEMILSVVNCGAGLIYLKEGGQFMRSIFDPDPLPGYYTPGVERCLKIARTGERAFNKGNFLFIDGVEGVHSLNAPIRSRGTQIGVISLIGECLQSSDSELIRLTTSVADEIGLAVENARQRRQSEETLILQERQRLARDLHDSVSQSLYGLVLSADIGKKLLKIKEYETLAKTLEDIESFALQSLREMRLMLFELRPLAFESEGLTRALQLRLNTVEARAGIQYELEVHGEELIPSPLDLELYRIATEALNNALKHANASHVRVGINVNKTEGSCLLEVSDNGSGFDTGNCTPGGIGLDSMQERAARVHGSLQVSSTPELGTLVQLTCPIHQVQKEGEA